MKKIFTVYAEATKIKPPQYIINAAKKGLKLRDSLPDSKKCCTRTGLARANQLANGEVLSIKTLKRMKSFLSRHGANLKASTPKDSKLVQSILLWGAEATKKGIQRVINWIDSQLTNNFSETEFDFEYEPMNKEIKLIFSLAERFSTINNKMLDFNESPCWKGYKRKPGTKKFDKGSCEKI